DFRFYDDCFTLNRNQVIKICELIIKHKLEITWWCNTRIDLIDEETILMIKKAGCRMINFGIESGSKKTLETINKRINLDQVIPKLKLIKKYQLQSSVNFIFGFPWEKKQDIKETWSFIKQISPYVEFIGATIFLPRPGTKIYKQLRKEVGYWWNKKIVFQTLKDVIVFDTSRLRYNLFPLDEKVLFEMKKIFKYIQKFNMRKLNLLSRINIYLWSYLSSFSFKMNPLFEKNYIQKAYRLYNSMIKRIKTTFL
ncbi:MAG: radical SAM protein, partial [Nanoarchaeota archaeon]|nr:radical SAM protein [Nanoarchaeota archaeon]